MLFPYVGDVKERGAWLKIAEGAAGCLRKPCVSRVVVDEGWERMVEFGNLY